MLFVLILVIIAIASGALLTYLYDEGAPLLARLCAGACTGFAALALAGFIFSSAFGLTNVSLVITTALLCAPFLLLRKPELKKRVRSDVANASRSIRRAFSHPTLSSTLYIIFYALISIMLWLVFDRAMYERADGIYTGFVNNLGDLPFHLQVISSFAHGANFPPEDPTYAGARFAYPFLADFIAAIFVSAGATLRQAIFVQNFVLAISLVGVLHRWTLELTRWDRLAGAIAPLLILFSGGLGWWLLFQDARKNESGLLKALADLPHDYTILSDAGYRWGNSLTTLFVTQRSILFGIPIAIVVFTQWWLALNKERVEKQEPKGKKKKAKAQIKVKETNEKPPFFDFSRAFLLSTPARRMIAAGVIAGLLPLIHAHSFIVTMGMAGCLALIFREWRLWIPFFAVAMLIAVPEMLWATHGSAAEAKTFLGWHFGWDRGEENVFWFWLKNTGLVIPLIFAAILWGGRGRYLVPRRLLLFYLPFTLCFIVPNLIKLAPWVWDNIKVLFYWYVASTPLIALFLSTLWRKGNWMGRIAAVALLVMLTLAGALDVTRIIKRTNEYKEFDTDGVRLAQMILRDTPPRSLILHAPTYNPVVFLTGRRSLLGYTGYIWAHGLDYIPREQDIKRVYAGAPDADAIIRRYGIDYIVVSPVERGYMPVNDSFFERYTKVGEAGEYRLYKVAQR